MSRNHESKARRGTQWAKRKRNVEQTLTTPFLIANRHLFTSDRQIALVSSAGIPLRQRSPHIDIVHLYKARGIENRHSALCWHWSQNLGYWMSMPKLNAPAEIHWRRSNMNTRDPILMKSVEVLKDCRSLNAAAEMNSPMPRSVEKVPIRNEKRCIDCFISLSSHQNWQTPHYLPLLNVTWMTFVSWVCLLLFVACLTFEILRFIRSMLRLRPVGTAHIMFLNTVLKICINVGILHKTSLD